jgi:hypothetical protein
MPNNTERTWHLSSPGRDPWPLTAALLLAPCLLLWTFPQTFAGLVVCAARCLQGYRPYVYRFGPFLFVVTRARGPYATGISLGLFIFSATPEILKHEFCHLFTALWLSWLYLPVYGIEYAVYGHDRSLHERLTCRLEQRLSWGYRCGLRG